MRILYCFLLSLMATAAASAQKAYFIYLQAENDVPFYVKVDDRIFTGNAYLILPELGDTTCSFVVGFPGSEKEGRFRVPINSKDHGFMIRVKDGNISLFDWSNSTQVQPEMEGQTNLSYERRTDDFTLLLSKAAGDPGLVLVPVVARQDISEKPVPRKEAPVQEQPVTVVVKKEPENLLPPPLLARIDTSETLTIVRDTTVITESAGALVKMDPVSKPVDSVSKLVDSVVVTSNTVMEKDPINAKADTAGKIDLVGGPVEAYRHSTVKKHSESSTSEGFGLVFYDIYEGGSDTIRLTIPNPKFVFKQEDQPDSEDVKVFDPRTDTASGRAVLLPRQVPCKAIASQGDFIKLRKAMAGEATDEAMVGQAKKAFKARCFTTDQVRNLSGLFMTAAGKYQFFNAAYLHVTDGDQFPALGSEIRDDYYLKRFKALIGE